MTDAPEPAKDDPEGAPGTELGLAGGNIIALGLTALGGLWVWAALAVAGAGVGLVAWRAQRRRQQRRTGSVHGSPSGRTGTRPAGRARSAGLPGFGRAGGGRRRGSSGTGRATGRGTGRGSSGRGLGRNPGRRNTAASSPGTGRTGNRMGKRPGLLGRTKGRNGSGSGRAGSGTGRTGRRLGSPSTWFGRGSSGGSKGSGASGGRGSGSGRRGSSSRKGATGSTSRPTASRPNLHKTDVVNTPTKKPTSPTAKPAPPRTDPVKPRAADKTNVPHPYRTTRTTKGSTIMAAIFGKAWRESAEETRSRATRYNPETMPDYLADMVDMAVAFELEADALGRITAISEADLPIHPKLVDYLTQTQATMRKVSADTQDVVKHFLKLHQRDLDRVQNRRPGEEKWNV